MSQENENAEKPLKWFNDGLWNQDVGPGKAGTEAGILVTCSLCGNQWMHSLQEYQACNTSPCPELKKTTPWTPWTPVNISDNGGHYEQRFRYTCKARLPDASLLDVGRQRVEMRYCSSDGSTRCSTDGKQLTSTRISSLFSLSHRRCCKSEILLSHQHSLQTFSPLTYAL